ncbi:hypothetical protein OF83DRAFT_1281691 [Amylostereum chailletii]|nr:hypothetical protein OF83DRAFT_1281691 [Amylostereum chailletii]
MKASASSTSASAIVDKKGHVCPPSNAKHPRDRWESLFVYSFVVKFTSLRGKVEGFNSPMDFEDALLVKEPHPVMTAILTRFILNLRPNTRNTSSDQISSTLSGVLSEYFKTNERTVFWDDDLKANVDPFLTMGSGFFTAEWDLKLKVLRQLVELQLSHSPAIKDTIDRAWGVMHNKHKKKDPLDPPPLDPNDPGSMENLQFIPLGQDTARKRYWVVDDSPRVYISSNPWKITATFESVSSTRDEYVALMERIKSAAPPESKPVGKRTKPEQAHASLAAALEVRLEAIDKEIARIQKARKKVEQRHMLMAQAEVRQTRTRRQVRRPDYVYYDAIDSDNEKDDEYNVQADEGYDEEADYANSRSDTGSSSRQATSEGRRRSGRVARNGGTKRTAEADSWDSWRGERRSTRLGAPPTMQLDEPPPKRARTEDSVLSTADDVEVDVPDEAWGVKRSGAAKIKTTEKAVEQVAGRKKSKFWFYAVEPIPGTDQPQVNGVNGTHENANGNGPPAADAMDLDPRSESGPVDVEATVSPPTA